MTDHLSTLQIKHFCVSALTEDEAAAAAVHMSQCQSCHQQFVEELRHQRGSAPFTFTLEPEFWFRHDHVDFELLVGLADKTLDEETEEIINIHLQACETCREDVRSFLAFREDTAREMKVSYGPTNYQPSQIPGAPWWQGLQRKPVYAVAAVVLIVVTVLIGVIAFNGSSNRLEANKQDQATPTIERSPGVYPSPDVASNVEDSVKVAVLKDAGGEVTIDRNGRVTGLDEVSENSRRYVARAALLGQIESADVLRRLANDPSGLRGSDDGPGFRLLYPVRRVVTEDRPVLRWQSLPGVSSYRVYVMDAVGNQVSESEELPPVTTEWKSARLRRGQIFSWVVMAVVDGKKVVSPSASASEVKFAILSAADFQELNHLQKSKSYLALGVFYARAGLLDQAEHEFQGLIKLNPDSELPRKLLQSVRSIRQGN